MGLTRRSTRCLLIGCCFCIFLYIINLCFYVYNSNCEGLHSDMLLCVCVCGQMACVCYLCWWGWRKPRGSMRIKLLLQLPCWHTHTRARFCLYLGKLFMLIIYTELGACFTVMCVCIWFGCEVACHCVCMHAWHSTLCGCVVGRFTVCVRLAGRGWCWQSAQAALQAAAHSVLIWCLVQRFGPYLKTRGRPCPFMKREVAECNESKPKQVFDLRTWAHRPEGERWLYATLIPKELECSDIY